MIPLLCLFSFINSLLMWCSKSHPPQPQIHLSPEGPGPLLGRLRHHPAERYARIYSSLGHTVHSLTQRQQNKSVKVLFMSSEVSSSWISARHKCCNVTMPRSGTSASTVMQLKEEVPSLSLYTICTQSGLLLSGICLYCDQVWSLPKPHLHNIWSFIVCKHAEGFLECLFFSPAALSCIWVCVHLHWKVESYKNPITLTPYKLVYSSCFMLKQYTFQTISTNKAVEGPTCWKEKQLLCAKQYLLWTGNPQTKVINWWVITGCCKQVTGEQ